MALLHKIHQKCEIESCTILFDKRLPFYADEVTEKPTPRVWKIFIQTNIYG